ncbi:MAG TPA: NAD-dependent epimerase/dehydratase family protein [Nitrosopumilaceae archaeon]|nr:NAD-dependent epimerase/dehydratase family protein [Nitrosopumilaceae archaeon]
MNFVVTGGAGFIGSHLVKHLIKQGHYVTVIDNLHTGKMENLQSVINEIEFLKINILDHQKLRDAVKKADGVFHEAALTVVQDSFYKQEEYHEVNVKGTENILKLAKEFGFKVVYASSSSVYGNPTKIPIKEDSKRKPINPYGITKLEGEYMAEKYSKLGVSVIGLRYFNAYGEGQTDTYAGVIAKFMKNIAHRMPPVINGDGLQVRDFVFVEDIAKANLIAMKSKVTHAFFNIGSGIGISILELANLMIRLSGLVMKPLYDKSLEGEIKISQADISLAEQLLNWKPKTKLEDWLSKKLPKIQERVG